MSADADIMSEREEIEMLLPWYAMGKLDATEKQRVDAYLASHPDMRRQLALVEDERQASVLGNEAIRAPRAEAVDRLLAEIASAPEMRARGAAKGLLSSITSFFSASTPAGLRFAALAAALVIAVQGAALVSLLGPWGDGYRTASGGPGGALADGTFALVKFKDFAPARAIVDALAAEDMTIVEGPKAGGVFRMRIGAKDMPQADIERKLELLRKQSGVFALVTSTR